MRILLFIAVFATTFSNAQNVPDHPYIEVVGKSEMLVMPDQIYVSIVLKDKEKGKKLTTTDQQLDVLKAKLESLNIPLSKLSLAHSSADYIRVKFRKKGVKNKASYRLILKNAKEVSDVFKMLDEVNVYQAHITEVTHSKIVHLQKEMRISAVQAAREKADYLLKELDAKRGLPLVVREENNSMSYRANSRYSNNISMSSLNVNHEKVSMKNGQIGFRKIKVVAQVYVKFLIKENN